VIFRLLNVITMISLSVALMAPLLYALATLRGMRHKRVYPILRLKGHDGRVSLVQGPDGGPKEFQRNGGCYV